MKRIKRRKVLALLFFLVSSFAYYQVQGGFVSGFLFYALLALTLLEGLFILGTSGHVVVNRRVYPTSLTADSNIEVEIDLHFKRFLPFVWFTIYDRLPNRLAPLTEENRLWRMGNFRKKYKIKYRIRKMPRGEHQFSQIEVRVGDLFGFFERVFQVNLPATVLVYPKALELRYFHSINEKNAGISYAIHRSAEDVTSVMGIRNYVSGDRLSRIHWKASARTGQLKTKEFEFHVTNDFMFFIDCERKSFQHRPKMFERAVSLAATLVRYALNNGFTAGLSYYRSEAVHIPLARHQEQLFRIFVQLARIEADGTESFAKHLMSQSPYIPFGTTAMVITSRIDNDLIMALATLRLKKISVELFYIHDQLSTVKHYFDQLIHLGVSVHLIDSDDFVEQLQGVGVSGQVS